MTVPEIAKAMLLALPTDGQVKLSEVRAAAKMLVDVIDRDRARAVLAEVIGPANAERMF